MIDLLDFPFLDTLPPGIREWTVRIFLALLIFGFVMLIRRLLAWILLSPFRAWTKRSEHELDDAIYNVVEPASGYLVVAVALLLGIQILEVGNVEIIFIQRLARTLIIVGIGVGAFNLINMLESQSRLMSATGFTIDQQLMPFIRTALKIILGAVLAVVVIQEWGYDVSGLIAGLGLGGLAFSLAAQDTVSNLFGFSTIVGDRPFVVGEYIITPNGEGIVERVGVRSTKIRTLDQSLIVVPNSAMANNPVTNWSRLSKRRYNFTIGITYGTTSNQMRALLDSIKALLDARPQVDSETIVVRFTEFASSSLDILVRCNVNIADWGEWVAEREEINLSIMDIVDEMGLSMAFPSRSIYVEQMPGMNMQPPPREPDTPRIAPAPMPEPPSPTADEQQDEAGDSPTSGV
jgi:MscS family membrane protein